MSETTIPEDVLRAAEKAFKYGFGLRYDVAVGAIAKAILAERESHGWQPIETAPKDGTIVDLWHVKGFRVVDEWWDADDGWTGGWFEDQFTHWMKSPIEKP